MERLRKRFEDFRLKVRQFVMYNWYNEPEGDRFRSLDILYVLGAIRFKPTEKWQRICWNTYWVMSVCSFSMLVLNALDEIPGKFDLVKATWNVTVFLSVILCSVKGPILSRFFESLQAARNFINSKAFGSGDLRSQISNEAACRKKCFQRVQFAAVAFLVVVLIDVTICTMPIPELNELFGIPRIVQYSLGTTLAGIIRILFHSTIAPIWFSKYYAGTGIICSLLYGFITEYEIFVSGFENILENVYIDIEEEFSTISSKAAPEWKRFKRDQLYWKYLKQRVNEQVKLHVQFVENLQLLKPVVKTSFGVIYYHLVAFISPPLYIVLRIEFSGASLLLLSVIVAQLIECYMWCRLIDSLKDINAKLELKIMDLITKVPYSQMHRTTYAEMRTTLCIMKNFVRNHEPFSCGGVFPISVEAFTDLLHIAYTVFTFLRDMGKKTIKTHRRIGRKQKH